MWAMKFSMFYIEIDNPYWLNHMVIIGCHMFSVAVLLSPMLVHFSHWKMRELLSKWPVDDLSLLCLLRFGSESWHSCCFVLKDTYIKTWVFSYIWNLIIFLFFAQSQDVSSDYFSFILTVLLINSLDQYLHKLDP